MGLFRRWFRGAEQRSGEAVAGPAAPDTLEQQGRRNAASEESAKSDIERGEDALPSRRAGSEAVVTLRAAL